MSTMNKGIVIGVIFCVLIASCKEVSFKEAQPKIKKQLSSVPKSLRGKYVAYREDGNLAQDTIIIDATGYTIAYSQPEDSRSPYDNGRLSDSLVLKNYKGYYFLSLHEKPEWILRVLKPEKNGDLIIMAPEQEGVDFSEYISKLSKQIRIDSTLAGDKMIYQIDPSADQLVSLIERGYFSRAVLKRVK